MQEVHHTQYRNPNNDIILTGIQANKYEPVIQYVTFNYILYKPYIVHKIFCTRTVYKIFIIGNILYIIHTLMYYVHSPSISF